MFCVSPVFHEREMHLLNLEVSDFFNGDFIRVSKVIVNICAIVAFMIPQHEIANFYWFICLIRTFTENALLMETVVYVITDIPLLFGQSQPFLFLKNNLQMLKEKALEMIR